MAKIREARAAKPAPEPIPVEDIEAALPHAEAALEAVTGAPKGSATIQIVDKLEGCLRAAEQVMSYARTTDGDVRNAKLLLAATEAQRRGLETALRIATELRSLQANDAFHAAVIDEFRKFSPEVGRRLGAKLLELTTVRASCGQCSRRMRRRRRCGRCCAPLRRRRPPPRSPAIITIEPVPEEPDWPVWLGETEGDAVSLLRPAQEDVPRLWPMSGAVNNARNDGPELLAVA